MLKNRAVQVKMVKTPNEENDTVATPHFTPAEMEWIGSMVKTVGLFYLAKVSLDVVLKLYLKS